MNDLKWFFIRLAKHCQEMKRAGTGWSLRSFPPQTSLWLYCPNWQCSPHKQVRVNKNEELSYNFGVDIPKKERIKIRTWRQRMWRSTTFILPDPSHPKVVPINHIRQERNTQSLIPPTLTQHLRQCIKLSSCLLLLTIWETQKCLILIV